MWALVFAAALSARLTPAPPCDVPAWRDAFRAHWRAYPAAQPTDLYKFAHHGIMGSEHAVGDTTMVSAWMRQEVAGLANHPEPGPHQAPLVESLPPHGQFVRVHLRPYLAQHASPTRLLEAFVATANAAHGDTAQFACAEQALASLGDGHDTRPVLTFFAAQRRAGFGAVHHSDAFEAAYAPAYRVVGKAWVARIGLPETPQ